MLLDKRQTASIQREMLRVAAREDLPPTVRLDALAAGPASITLTPKLLEFLLAQLAPAQPTMQRIGAASAIGRAKLDDRQLLALAPLLQTAGPLEIDHLVGAFGQSHDANVGHALVRALTHAKALTALHADALRTRLGGFDSQVQREAAPLLARLNPDAGQQTAHLDELIATTFHR